MTRLTDRKIKSLKPRRQRYDLADSDIRGLHVRVSELGTKSFVLVLRYPGAKYPARRSIGIYPETTLAEAREKAREWRSLVKRGIDPKEEERRLRVAEASKRSCTVAAVAEDYIAMKVRRLRSAEQIEGDIRREIISRWAERPISSITRGDVIGMVRQISERAPYSARNVYAWARAMFNWTLHEDAYGLGSNPCSGLKVDEVIGQDREARERVLNDAEIRALWRASDRMGFPWGSLFQLLLLTGCRRNEIGDARWSEYDEAERVLRIPRERVKANGQHVVVLSAMAMDIITSLPRISGSPYILSVSGHTPLAGHADAKRRLDRLMAEELGCKPEDFSRDGERAFVVHDLRRTVRTKLARLKVDYVTAELILGHVLSGIHGVYDKHGYESEKREALELLANHLREVMSSDAMAPLPLFTGQRLEGRT